MLSKDTQIAFAKRLDTLSCEEVLFCYDDQTGMTHVPSGKMPIDTNGLYLRVPNADGNARVGTVARYNFRSLSANPMSFYPGQINLHGRVYVRLSAVRDSETAADIESDFIGARPRRAF